MNKELEKLKREKSAIDNKISKLENKIEKEKWKDTPVCDHDYYGIRGGKCSFADVYHGKIFCKNPNCKS